MKKEQIQSPQEKIPRKGLSQAIKYGNILFVGGRVGCDLDGNVPDGIEAEVELAITNAKAIIEAAGATLDDVLMCQCFIKSADCFADMNKAYFKFFGDQESGPARYTVVAQPVSERFSFEIAMYVGV